MQSNPIMNLVAAAALFCLLASAAAPTDARLQLPFCPSQHDRVPVVGDRSSPWFCHGLDCPAFNRTKVKEGWEEREYEKAQWVETAVHCLPFSWALPKGFRRLFSYISGANLERTKLDMTSPVVTLLRPKYGFRESKKNYTVAFFIPKAEKEEPPVPRDRALVVRSTPRRKVYVRSFSGFASEQTILGVAARLADALEVDGTEIHKGQFYFASYDPPFRLCHRHNEVWMLPKDEPHDGAMGSLQPSLPSA